MWELTGFGVGLATAAIEGDEMELTCVVATFQVYGLVGFNRQGREDGSRFHGSHIGMRLP